MEWVAQHLSWVLCTVFQARVSLQTIIRYLGKVLGAGNFRTGQEDFFALASQQRRLQ